MHSYDPSHVLSKGSNALSVDSVFSTFISQCRRCFRFYACFHVIFISFLSLQLLTFLLFFSYFSKSIACASALALFFLTLFSYFVLMFFFQTKKPQQLLSIAHNFLQSCETIFKARSSSEPANLQLAQVILKGTALLSQVEVQKYNETAFISALSHLTGKCKTRLHWKNFHAMKEILLSLSIEQVTEVITQKPLDLGSHALLAEIYLQYSMLYLPPDANFRPWIPAEYFSPTFHQKFLACSNRAAEECLILEEYGEKNTWLYTKLAKVYELQENLEKETECQEELLSLSQEDPKTLSRLGLLYFKQGLNAKGLKVYEELQRNFPEESEGLIKQYPFLPFEEPLFS